MDNNEMNLDEWYKSSAEFCEGLKHDVEEDENDVDGNLYDVGRYRYTRSSEDRKTMMGENASFISACNRWFESFGCGYTCERDGRASIEADDWDLMEFHYEHPFVNCKEAFFELTYGNTEDSVSRAFFSPRVRWTKESDI